MNGLDYLHQPPTASTGMLAALNRTKREGEIYQGTVPAAVKARRRAKNRVARRQRAVNRRR
jgi:hypothetical protein